jgi:hypothetical protein
VKTLKDHKEMTDLKKKVLKRIESRAIVTPSGCRVIEKIYKNSQGYGTIKVESTMYFLHRVVFWLNSDYLHINDLPAKLQVAHGCKELCCILPEHYSLVTPKQNASHKVRDGTQTYGEQHHGATITQVIAQNIASSWKPPTDSTFRTQKQRADLFGVKQSLVADIDNRRSWPTLIHPNGRSYQDRNDKKCIRKAEARLKTIYSKSDIEEIKTRLSKRSVINHKLGCHDFNGKYRDVPELSIFHQTKSGGRWAAIVATGKYEHDLQALHSCGRGKICVNPEHMRWGTIKENMQDKKIHGTTTAKVTDQDILDISHSDQTVEKLIQRYKLARSTVQQIRRGDYPRLESLTNNLTRPEI